MKNEVILVTAVLTSQVCLVMQAVGSRAYVKKLKRERDLYKKHVAFLLTRNQELVKKLHERSRR